MMRISRSRSRVVNVEQGRSECRELLFCCIGMIRLLRVAVLLHAVVAA